MNAGGKTSLKLSTSLCDTHSQRESNNTEITCVPGGLGGGGSDGCLKGHLTAFFFPVTIMDATSDTNLDCVCILQSDFKGKRTVLIIGEGVICYIMKSKKVHYNITTLIL